MGKSLYSVVLMDEVVREIDRLALRENTNRSNIINQILAEYVSYVTPEMRINGIFRTIEAIINDAGTPLVPTYMPHQSTMSLKGNIEYRYRPTVKYEVELFRNETEGNIGRLSVVFRSQSDEFLERVNDFFRVWCYYEGPLFNREIVYISSGNRLTRNITVREGLNGEQIANAIGSYIRLFDDCLKNFLSGRYSEQDVFLRLKAHTVKEVLV